MKLLRLLPLLLFISMPARGQSPDVQAQPGMLSDDGGLTMPAILSMRERAAVIDRMLEDRLRTVVPALMDREQVDLWIIAAREYNEDPVVRTMLPATWLAARRRTVLVLHRTDSGVEGLAVARYAVGPLFEAAWDPEEQPDQWQRLADLVADRDPERIAINVSETFALGDGLTHSEYQGLTAALAPRFRDRLVSGDRLSVGWLETRTALEMEMYPHIVRIARTIIREGFSDQAISPGVTTTDDVVWWYRDRIRDLGLITWFHPSVSVQRAETGGRDDDFSSRPDAAVIRRGDLLHVDFGITYLRLNTDTQQHAYVLRHGETDAPQGLRHALAVGNRLQDVLTDEFEEGRSGNQILAAALAQAAAEGIRATIYTHPIGFHGHGAGPTIGLWDQQGGVPGRGDYPLFANTAHSIELNAVVAVPEWGKDVRIMLEEDAIFDGRTTTYIDPRQERMYLIR
ncbi:MAG: M24 family metallopeptidase [Rhodothermales bacterium]|nr:M24 family metallopeptidase [Rhodothermales bacterium]MBO6778583.1 M24 family metallopeptidase [Rhodothermales bacterium]